MFHFYVNYAVYFWSLRLVCFKFRCCITCYVNCLCFIFVTLSRGRLTDVISDVKVVTFVTKLLLFLVLNYFVTIDVIFVTLGFLWFCGWANSFRVDFAICRNSQEMPLGNLALYLTFAFDFSLFTVANTEFVCQTSNRRTVNCCFFFDWCAFLTRLQLRNASFHN